MTDPGLYAAAEKFVTWLDQQLTLAGRGDPLQQLPVEPAGKFWLGRLAPQETVMKRNLGNRGERLEPCAIGIRLRTPVEGPWRFHVHARALAWLYSKEDGNWHKTEPARVDIPIELSKPLASQSFGQAQWERELARVTGTDRFSARIQIDCTGGDDHFVEWEIQLVNVSDEPGGSVRDTNLYECTLEASVFPTEPFLLESLPNSFRYDRRVPCYGINCGVDLSGSDTFRTTDVASVRRSRPHYWNVPGTAPDFQFEAVARDPVARCTELLSAMRQWGERAWGTASLNDRAQSHGWTDEMRAEANSAAAEFDEECRRVEKGIDLLKTHEQVSRAFVLMNRSMAMASSHPSWRPFQLGFLLANLATVLGTETEANIADIVWFATGGGKTETYLGMILTAAFFDRLSGKRSGVTAWSRFPLRMLSLQQTQRFADALAAGERLRRSEKLGGAPLSLGFFVGEGATPNSIPEEPAEGQFDCENDEKIESARVLLRCPFCRSESLRMAFDRLTWRLSHQCTNDACSWPEDSLPFYIVDDEIYRFLPTVVVGTLDKAAGIAMQASMRGLVGPPWGVCSQPGHGYTYAIRSKRPTGCLVPGCTGHVDPLPMEATRYGPTYRLQDELHLLKDSLGAVDSHYEALYDDLQLQLSHSKPKILASSATLEGYQRQVDVLYRRRARVFPVPGPSATEGFWSADSDRLMRRYSAVAPRGVTVEYTVDRLLTELQTCIRKLELDPVSVCRDAGIDESFAPALVSLYGTNVVYGNTIRDLEAVDRSIRTQVQVSGVVNTANLTGRTDFDDVRRTLHRLQQPESDFAERLHVITASSMMSHGVDIDRLNVMVMMGLPLTTAEFIQASARVGRTWPGLVIVIPKIARERDAAMYRCFTQFITQGDRLIEPVPITRRSRRVLDRTIPGLELARVLMIHEPNSGGVALSTLVRFRDFLKTKGVDVVDDAADIERMLALVEERDEPLRNDIREWFREFARNIADPPDGARFLSQACPYNGPMRSLRDVEEQVPIHTRYT